MSGPSSGTVVASLASGAAFGAGLVIAGMTDPDKVIGFLDVADGSWDPSLALVMAGAIGVHGAAHRVLKRRPSPLFAARWSLPTRRDVDGRLILGAALFGVGWGLGGLCPGPGIVSLAGGAASSAVFVATMLLATWLTKAIERAASKRADGAVATDARTPDAR